MSSTGGSAESRVAGQLSLLTAAVDGLLGADVVGLSDAEVVDAIRNLERALRRAGAVSHRLVVESVERSLPASFGYVRPTNSSSTSCEYPRPTHQPGSARPANWGCGTPRPENLSRPRCRIPRPRSGTAT